MKPHRQVRSNKRVSSETGVALVTTGIRESTYQEKLGIIRKVLRTCSPAERRAMLAHIAREELTP